MLYKLLLSDCPWKFYTWSGKNQTRNADFHYPTMNTAEICALAPDVKRLMDPSSVLLLWGTWPNLPDTMRVMAEWGYKYKTVALVWAKQQKKGAGWHMGLGYYTRANTEFLLLGTKGKPLPRYSKAVPQLLVARLREHSQKPLEQYERIERLFGDVPRLELFARHVQPGWSAFGHGVTGDMTLEEYADAQESA